MGGGTPVLWQIKVSHYNEKARWALDYKRVEHRRRAPLPLIGTLPIAWVLTRGTTFPVLRLDGRSIGDSSRIIAALEERFPRPPLYPSDRSDRERALALEEFFDEQVAPHVRRLVWYETTTAPRAFMATAMPDSGRVVRRALGLAAAPVAALVRRRYAVTTRTAAAAREQIVDGMRRLEREIGPGGYLAGDSFSVADLSAAAIFTPLLRPPEHPYLPAAEFPQPLRRFCDELEGMPGADWVLDTYRRHRGVSAETQRTRSPRTQLPKRAA